MMKKTIKRTIKQLSFVLMLTAGLSLTAAAQSPADAPEHCIGGAPQPHGPEALPRGPMPGAFSFAPPMADFMPPPFLQELELSEAQQDKIFSLMLANAPLLREQEKLARKSEKELRAQLESGQFDEAKIRALAETHARAQAQLMVMHARGMHQILASLTTEQRAQIDAMKVKFEAHQGPHGRSEETHEVHEMHEAHPKSPAQEGPARD